jgi:hypothetical protein
MGQCVTHDLTSAIPYSGSGALTAGNVTIRSTPPGVQRAWDTVVVIPGPDPSGLLNTGYGYTGVVLRGRNVVTVMLASVLGDVVPDVVVDRMVMFARDALPGKPGLPNIPVTTSSPASVGCGGQDSQILAVVDQFVSTDAGLRSDGIDSKQVLCAENFAVASLSGPTFQGTDLVLQRSKGKWMILNATDFGSGVWCADYTKYGVPHDAWIKIHPFEPGAVACT